MPPDPLTCVSLSLNAKYHYSSGDLQDVQLTYFGNTPAIQNSTPASKISGHGLILVMRIGQYFKN